MGDLYGTSIDTADPLFGPLTDDGLIARQKCEIAVGTEPGSLDEFLEYGFLWDDAVLRAVDATQLALLPLEVRMGIEQEPAFASVDVTQTVTRTPGGVRVFEAIEITGAEGDRVGFTLGGGS